MNENLRKVEEFQRSFGMPVGKIPSLIKASHHELAFNLIDEELEEFQEAYENEDLVEIADALVDIQYVLNVAILKYGLQHKFDEMFEEVHESNMSKMCDDVGEAYRTIEDRKLLNGNCYYEKMGDKYVVYRYSDGKIMKSVSYFKPDLKKIIESHKEDVCKNRFCRFIKSIFKRK
jgi:predicted HAD superfamily Cof-like phosphohydrolase